MSLRVVTVFGGTGFLGRRVVRHLRERDFSVRIASRHPERGDELKRTHDQRQRERELADHERTTQEESLAVVQRVSYRTLPQGS